MAVSYSNVSYALYLTDEQYALYRGDSWGFKPDGTQDFSITVWFWPDNANPRLLTGGEMLTLDLKDDTVVFWLKGCSDLYSPAKAYPILRHEWNHIAVTFNRYGQVIFYINGMKNDVFSIAQKEKAQTWNDIYFGSGLDGYLKNVKFYAKVLTSIEVQNDKIKSEKAPSPIRWFDFESAVPTEKITHTALELHEKAKIYEMADGLFCDEWDGFFPLDGEFVNPGGNQDACYTVQAWISIYSKEQNFAVLFLNGTHWKDCGMVLYLEKKDNQYYLCARRGSHNQEKNILRSSTPLLTRKWINVAVTFDGKKMCLYVNGTLNCQTENLVSFTESMGIGEIRIGTDDLPGLEKTEGSFNGSIANIAVWTRALSAQEITTYAQTMPDTGTKDLCAHYIFTRFACYNAVTGCDISMVGINTDKVCRNPVSVTEKIVYPNITPQPNITAPLTSLQSLCGKNLQEWKTDYAAAVPDAKTVLETFLYDTNESIPETIMKECSARLDKYLTDIRSGKQCPGFYTSQFTQSGECQVYLISDGIYQVDSYALNETSAFSDWLIRVCATLIIDVLSIYCSVPSDAEVALPQALREIVNTNQLITMLAPHGQIALKKFISHLIKGLFSGGIFIDALTRLAKKGIIFGTADVVSLVISFLAKISSTWGWALVAVRVIFLVYDLYDLWTQMPKILGAELSKLYFGMPEIAYVPSSKYPLYRVPSNVAQWNILTSSKEDPSPVVYSLYQVQQMKQLSILAQFQVFQSGKYHIIATPVENDAPCCYDLLGSIDCTKNLQPGKDGLITVELPLTNHKLQNASIQSADMQWNWIIQGPDNYKRTYSTCFRLFLLYDTPRLPWGGKSGIPVPWMMPLELVCCYACGIQVKSDNDVEKKIIKAIMNCIWHQKVSYQETSSYIKNDRFLFTHWVADCIKNTSYRMNVNDCAALLVTLCNLLGCNLKSVLLTNSDSSKGFKTKSIKLLNQNTGSQKEFKTYETVMELCGEEVLISDACCQVTNGAQSNWEHPVMLPFHTKGEVTGFCELFAEKPEECTIAKNQRVIENGIRIIE